MAFLGLVVCRFFFSSSPLVLERKNANKNFEKRTGYRCQVVCGSRVGRHADWASFNIPALEIGLEHITFFFLFILLLLLLFLLWATNTLKVPDLFLSDDIFVCNFSFREKEEQLNNNNNKKETISICFSNFTLRSKAVELRLFSHLCVCVCVCGIKWPNRHTHGFRVERLGVNNYKVATK